jgi:hypothetical protein
MDTNTAPARKSALRKWLSEPAFPRRRHGFRTDTPLPTADRKVLEGVILPFYTSAPDIERILVVSSAHRNAAPRLLTAKRVDYIDATHSLSIDGSYDLVMTLGVLGTAWKEPEDCDRLLAACYLGLRPGGHLMLDWYDEADAVQVDALPVLECFVPYIFPPLHAVRQLTDTFTRHTFQFFRKPAAPLDG